MIDTSQQSTNSTNSFLQASVAMEVANEIQNYTGCSASNIEACSSQVVFSGVQESCTKGWLGLKNCCKAQPGGKNNSAMVGLVLGPLASTVKFAGQSAVDAASPYVFDAMYSSGLFTQGLNNAIIQSQSVITNSDGFASQTIFSSGGLSLGAYGFTFNSGASAGLSGSGLLGGNIELSSLSSATDAYSVTFNPYVFAASLAVNVIEDMQACMQSEVLLALHRGDDLSVYINEQCNQSEPIGNSCMLYQDNYCSFNSILSKIVNQQGKQQLGIDFSNCAGLSIEQVQALDFSKIDFSEFSSQLTNQAQSNLPTNVGQNYLPIEQGLSAGSVQSPANAMSYPSAMSQPSK
jgi:conjugal transfer mating pair stabilization protein TraN